MRATRLLLPSLSASDPPVPSFVLHDKEETADDAAQRPTDPLRWFGILAPPELRKAQGEAVAMVELVPRLVEVDAEMRMVEVEIRRARKRGVKAARRRGVEEKGVEREKGVI
jgi:hypothetical protein